jgi:hypothetical protein
MRLKAVISSGAILMTAAFGAVSAQASSITSTFDTDAEGWVVGDNGSQTVPYLGGTSAPTYQSTLGNPGGFIETNDLYSSNAFYAPAAFLGNQSAFYGGTLSFSLQEQVAADINPGTAVVLYSGGSAIAFAAPAPGTTWDNYSVSLTAAGWTTYAGNQSVGGAAVSAATFQSFLANITALSILADWHNGSDLVGLDTVALNSVSAVPLPASLPLLVSALGGLGFLGWRRRQHAAA